MIDSHTVHTNSIGLKPVSLEMFFKLTRDALQSGFPIRADIQAIGDRKYVG